MKNIFTLIFLVLSICIHTSAQTEFMDRGGKTALRKGSFQFNIGSGYTNWGVPIYGGIEFAFNEDITLGGFASYSSYTENWLNLKWRHNVFSTFGCINMHVNRLLKFEDNVDLYGGISLGYNSVTTEASDDLNPGAKYSGDKNSGLLFLVQAGARYYFVNNLGALAEVTMGSMSGIHVGLTYRLN